MSKPSQPMLFALNLVTGKELQLYMKYLDEIGAFVYLQPYEQVYI